MKLSLHSPSSLECEEGKQYHEKMQFTHSIIQDIYRSRSYVVEFWKRRRRSWSSRDQRGLGATYPRVEWRRRCGVAIYGRTSDNTKGCIGERSTQGESATTEISAIEQNGDLHGCTKSYRCEEENNHVGQNNIIGNRYSHSKLWYIHVDIDKAELWQACWKVKKLDRHQWRRRMGW